MVTERDLVLPDGRTLHLYDTGGPARLTVLWHHGTPNLGTPPPFPAAGIRWISYDRPGYGTSTPTPRRTVGDAAGWATAAADALGVGRFAVMGHSGGSSHALATAALLPDRVVAVASLAAVAPFHDDGWFDGMASPGALKAATAGRAAKEEYEAGAEFDPAVFTERDFAALKGSQSWLDDVVQGALAGGIGGLVDDDLAYVSPWGADPARIAAPVLLLHGDDDRMVPAHHSAWLAGRCPRAELRHAPGDGHLSVLGHAADALAWLSDQDTSASEATAGAM
ncbi:alpha/beta hydrolase [Amycolatopsis sp. OK19-0408]|uniref:Alpha/beta hydrolase n=1 Tax=Amycolatopsis iheyensis TaxID=2945988 RepID=A0A9X2N831_9PSEU|nr:alpha/beta hydrolase [Amycolatopsis iheyensis]MCR6483704.1 alpha/beta hydrolase [Amycolatopsis iheyensis]